VAVEIIRADDTGRPRRARPKDLDAPPAVYRGGSPTGPVLQPGDGEGTGEAPTTAGANFTAESAQHRLLAEVLGEPRTDSALHEDALAIAAELALRPRRSHDQRRGRTRPALARFDGSADELDLDATLELLAERRPLRADELLVRRPLRARRSVALLADVSGSMDGVKARIAAAAVGALTAELFDDELTVIAFWKDLAVLRTREAKINAAGLLNDLLRIEPKGLTNVHGAIELATRELAKSSLERRCIVLLSDCVHNAGPDPRLAAQAAPVTHVLLEKSGEHDMWLGERIARAGGGRFCSATSFADVAPALTKLLHD
jgi:Mg-chelatase subunit ChlD